MKLIFNSNRILPTQSVLANWLVLVMAAVTLLPSVVHANESGSDTKVYDVVIYGGTAAGIVAAVQVERLGGSAIVIEPSSRIGGLTTGGLGQTDIGNKAAIGGISREFYQRISQYYQKPENWKWQT
ncbi:FAD-dependent oxidoreductase, partial [Novipirellula sp.]|uniref:FAD-dependent oxidoreductase n=1 Tax=Novipirellula sp. TaxID=2795430 RepID=UPI003562E5E7